MNRGGCLLQPPRLCGKKDLTVICLSASASAQKKENENQTAIVAAKAVSHRTAATVASVSTAAQKDDNPENGIVSTKPTSVIV